MNDAKTDIVKFPQPFESKWTIELSSFGFSRNAKRQRLQIGQFFSLLYQSCHEHPEESVVKYGIKVLHRCSLQKANWSYLESLLLKTVIEESRVGVGPRQVIELMDQFWKKRPVFGLRMAIWAFKLP